MYSETRFQNAKTELAYSILHSPTDAAKQIEALFLRSLLCAAADRGQVTPDDVYRAVEASGAFDLDLDEGEKDKIIADLWNIGDNYVGALSRQQTVELRKLRNLCHRANKGDMDAVMMIADMI
jgi:hypothetical protein